MYGMNTTTVALRLLSTALLTAGLGALPITNAAAQSTDSGGCGGYSGAAFDTCKQFCATLSCTSADAPQQACTALRTEFESQTGSRIFPCELKPLGNNKSSPIDITGDGAKLVAANTDTDTVSIFRVSRSSGRLTKLAELGVGDEPRSVATLLRSPLAYVANAASATVSV